MKWWVSLLYLCTAWNISLFRWYEKHYYFLVLIYIHIYICMCVCVCLESNKTNLMLLYLGQINKKWLLSSNGPLQFGQSVTAIGRVWIKWGKGGEFRQILKKKDFICFQRLHFPFQKWGICLICATTMSVLLDKKSLDKCAFRLLASFLNWQWIMLNFLIPKL
jgi:hypothetical protein